MAWSGRRLRAAGHRRKHASLILTRHRTTVQGPRSSVIHHRGRLRHSGTRANDVRRTDASASASAYVDQAWRGEAHALVDRATQAASHVAPEHSDGRKCSRAWRSTASSSRSHRQLHSQRRVAAAAHQRSVGGSSAGMLIERAIEHAVASGADVTATPPTKSNDSSRSVESSDPALPGRQNMTNFQPSPMNGPPPRGKRRAPADRAHVGVDGEGDVGAARPVRTPAPPHAIVDMVDEWGRQSFPASDPPSNW